MKKIKAVIEMETELKKWGLDDNTKKVNEEIKKQQKKMKKKEELKDIALPKGYVIKEIILKVEDGNDKIRNAMVEASRKVCYKVGYDKCREDVEELIKKCKVEIIGDSFGITTELIDKNKLKENIKGLKTK